jgi:esterase
MIHAKQYSSANQDADPNLIIIHGLFGNADNWHSIAQSLSEHFNLYCIDLPNHGKSSAMPDATYPKMAQAIIDWAVSENIQSFSLLGHSMGGKVAMQIAAMADKTANVHVEKLIVADMSPVDYEASHTDILAGLKVLQSSQINSRKEADDILSNYEPSLPIRQFLLKNLVRAEDKSYQLTLSVDNIFNSYSTILKKPLIEQPVNLPTLFIKGEHSDYIVAEYQQAIMEAFPQASFKIIPGTGHWLHAEKPLPFTSLVKRFLQSN